MKILLFLFLIVLGSNLSAQTKQVQSLLQQIAALEVYKSYLSQGYRIVKGGWNLVQDFKNGEFSLHKNYFASLKRVNPHIKRYARVAEVISLQINAIKNFSTTLKSVKKGGMMSIDELRYLQQVFDRLIEDCTAMLDELIALISDNQLELKDDERIKRIDKLYNQMLGSYDFSKSFCQDIQGMAATRTVERAGVKQMEKNYGLNSEL